MSKLQFGCHIPVRDTLTLTYEYLSTVGLTTSQIYLPDRGRSLSYSDIIASRTVNPGNKFIHSCLASNLAGSTDGTLDPKYTSKLSTAKTKVLYELDVASVSGASVVVHVGYSKNHTQELMTVIDTINDVLTRKTKFCDYFSKVYDVTAGRRLLLENAAGETNRLGSTFDDLKFILDGVKKDITSNVQICIDTAHVYGRGLYDLSKTLHVQQFFQDFSRIFGKDKLSLIHLNDSEVQLGSGKDRHENLTKGYIFGKDGGTAALKELLNISAIWGVPIILETPGNVHEDLTLIKSLL